MYEKILKSLGLNSIEGWMTTIAKIVGNDPMKPKLHWTLHKINPGEILPEKLVKKYNVSPGDRYYQLRKDGEPMSDEWFRRNVYCTNEQKFDKERYLVLVHMKPSKYPDSVVETCDLKSPWHFEGYECVFDKERGKIIYEVENTFDDHLYVHGNLLEHRDARGETKFVNLAAPQHTVAEFESCEYWEGSDRLFIRTPKYGDPQNILTITYEDCKVEVLDTK